MIRALIVDDEALSRRALRQLMDRHHDVSVVGECGDGVAAIAAVETESPDVMFLDISMPEVSGLEVARHRVGGATPLVVFVTAYDNFAIPAFETEAVDYLTKPVAEERFDAALQRVRDRLRLMRSAARAEAGEPPERLTPLVSRVRDVDIVIPVDSIEYIEADDVYAVVHALGRRHLVRISLDALERSLDRTAFVRIHRSYIVRVSGITALRRGSDGGKEVVVASGAALPVSRRRKGALDDIMRGIPR